MSGIKEIVTIPEYKGIKLGSLFSVPAKYFGKDCFSLYKVIGFNPDEDLVFANKRNKRTLKIEGHSLLLEGFKYSDVVKCL